MKLRTFRIILSRGWRNVMYSVSFFVFSMLSVSSKAQTVSDTAGIGNSRSKIVVSGPKPAAGDTITGRVTNYDGPMMMVRVEEKDSADRLVAHAVTDFDGKFNLRLVNPADYLEITNWGYHTAISEFTGNTMDVKMIVDTLQIKNVIDSILNTTATQIIREDKYQGLRARAYGPQYPQDANPLIVLNGNLMDLDVDKLNDFDFTNDSFSKEKVAALLGLKADQIISISILTGKAATKKWGGRAANGVLEVTSK